MSKVLTGKGGKMKAQISNQIKRGGNCVLMTITAIVAMVAFIPSSVALAWGPDRPTYTMAKPADHVTFNSITNNSTVGDERNFVHIKEAGAEKYSDSVEVVPGKEYIVYITYHNDAASNLNASGVGVATGVRLRSQFPTEVTPSKKGQISAVISSTNAEPPEVWDEAFMTTKYDQVLLRYKEGSAKIHNGWGSNGSVLSESMFESGTYLGMDELNGVILGCAEYGGFVTYTLVASNVGGEISKLVSRDGQNYYENVTARPGEEVTFSAEFKNTGTRDLTNVTFHDNLPEGMKLVNSTTYLYNNSHTNGELMTDIIDKNGFNTGAYGKDGWAKIIYKVKIADDAKCGSSLVNRIFMDSDQGEISDGATVNVECNNVPTELPSTGPAQIVGAIVVVGGIGMLAVYWYRSQMALKEIKK